MPPRSGIGYVMLKTRPRAIPICMEGMDEILPVGHFFPRLFRTIFIYYGKPVDLSEFYDREHDRETAQACIEKVFVSIHRQQKILKRYRRYRAHLLSKKPACCRFFKP